MILFFGCKPQCISVVPFEALSKLAAVQSYVIHPLTGAFFSVSFYKLEVEPRQAGAIFSCSSTAEQKPAESHVCPTQSAGSILAMCCKQKKVRIRKQALDIHNPK